MNTSELIERQITSGQSLLQKIEALQELPAPKNDFGDGMAVFSLPPSTKRFNEKEVDSLTSDLQKWQNISFDVLRSVLPQDSSYIKQFKESVSEKKFGYNPKRGLTKEVTRGISILESVKESISLNLVQQEKVPEKANCNKRLVFISHSSKDAPFIEPFKDIILKQALGLKDENIICTSFESTGVAPGDNIPQYIKDNIAQASVFLAMVSENYRASEVCMNEVGAAWALEKKLIQVVLPGVTFEQLGWLIQLDKAAKIDDGDSLDHLAESICDKLGITMPTPRHWNPSRASFLEAIAKAKEDYDNSNQPCLLCFQDGSQVTTIHPVLLVRYYSAPVSKTTKPTQNANYPEMSMVSALEKMAQQTSYAQQVQVAKPLSRETYKSMSQLVFYFVNDGDALENIEVRIHAPEGVSFSEDNYKNLGIGAINIIPHGDNYSVDESSYWCRIGDFNADSNRVMPLLYVEMKSVYKMYDVYASFDDCYPKQVILPYTISTKHKKYHGKLVLNVEPSFEEDYRESEKDAGRLEILPFVERA